MPRILCRDAVGVKQEPSRRTHAMWSMTIDVPRKYLSEVIHLPGKRRNRTSEIGGLGTSLVRRLYIQMEVVRCNANSQNRRRCAVAHIITDDV